MWVITVLRTVNVAFATNRPASGATTSTVILPRGPTLAFPNANVFAGGGGGAGDKVVNCWSGPKIVPSGFEATTR